MNQESRLKKNPSRQTCESVIRRILFTEVAERGRNEHFRQASDFMPYFESLYPASDSLTKQVQRAIKSMNLPKDEKGFFIINKSHIQVVQDQEINRIFRLAKIKLEDLSDCEIVFLQTADGYSDYLIHLLSSSESLKGQFVTMEKTCNGILIYTRDKEHLIEIISSLS